MARALSSWPTNSAALDRSSPPPHSNLRQDDVADLQAIHIAVRRMSSLTGTDPYILTIPQDGPRYHHSYAFQARQWLEHTPFDPREHESTQYQTFRYDEPGSTMYTLHSSRPSESDSAHKNVQRGKEDIGGRSTPRDAPKKVMSLNAYKKKVAGQTPEPMEPGNGGEDKAQDPFTTLAPASRIKADEEMLAAVEQVAHPSKTKSDAKEARAGSVKDIKRKRGVHDAEDEERVAKKRRSTPPREQRAGDSRAITDEADLSSSTPGGKSANRTQGHPGSTASARSMDRLPPRLSPLHASHDSLPARLSPTLPTNIAATLKAHAPSDSALRSLNTSAKLSPNRQLSPAHASKRISPIPRNGFRANSRPPAARSDIEDQRRARSKLSVPTRTTGSQSSSHGDSEDGNNTTNRTKNSEMLHSTRRSLVVKMKFFNTPQAKLRKAMKGDLDLTAQPAAHDTKLNANPVDQKRKHRDPYAKGVAQKIAPSVRDGALNRSEVNLTPSIQHRSKLATERAIAEETLPQGPKEPLDSVGRDERDDVVTPSKQPGMSPASPPSSKKSFLTPSSASKHSTIVLGASREHLPAAIPMKRDPSNVSIGSGVETPAADSPSMPHQSLLNGVPKKQEVPRAYPKTDKQVAWEAEQKRLQALGKELKGIVEAHVKRFDKSGGRTADCEQRLAAVMSVESLLAFLLAFTCSDQASRSAEPKQQPSMKLWRSLHGYFGFVKHHCNGFPALLGLTCWLGVVFNAHILALAVHTLSASEAREGLLEASAMMHRAATEAECLLDADVLMETFPAAWAGRTKGGAGPAEEKPQPGKFGGAYKLPLGVQSSSVNAVRAAHAILEEWLRRGKDLAYTMKLKLDSGI